MTKYLTLAGWLMCGVFSGQASLAQTLLYTVRLDSVVQADNRFRVQFSSTNHTPLITGTPLNISMPDGRVLTGTVQDSFDEPADANIEGLQIITSKPIALDSESGCVVLHLYNASIVGMTIYSAEKQTLYRGVIDSTGGGLLVRQAETVVFHCNNR